MIGWLSVSVVWLGVGVQGVLLWHTRRCARRNERLQDFVVYTSTVGAEVMKAVNHDIFLGRPWAWRVEQYQSVTVDDIMAKPWKKNFDDYFYSMAFAQPGTVEA